MHESLVHAAQPSPRTLPNRSLLAAAVLLISALVVAASAHASVFQVNSLADTSDNNPGDGLCSTGVVVMDPVRGAQAECTLRGAIEEANAFPNRDEVRFESSLIYNANGVAEFLPATQYPSITHPIEIDGTTAPTHAPDLTPKIVIRDGGASSRGLSVSVGGDHSTIRGVTLLGFGVGINVDGADDVWIERCALGIRSIGPIWVGVDGNGIGILVGSTASNTWIGARVVGEAFVGGGNTVSGNADRGISDGGENTRIIGNKIGTDPTGQKREERAFFGGPLVSLGNVGNGILAFSGRGLQIGRVLETGSAPNATALAMGNVVSNNGGHGILVIEFAGLGGPDGIEIVANQIGTDSTGALDFGNGLAGISVVEALSGVAIGGARPEEANRIAGNDLNGIDVELGVTGLVRIEGNQLGVGVDGISPLANSNVGISVEGGNPVEIAGNTVGHSGVGISIGDKPVGATEVAGNFVGVTANGDSIGNAVAGIRVDGSGVTLVENTTGENGNGIEIGSMASEVGIYSNWIGTDVLGRDLGNANSGIQVDSTVGVIEIGRVLEGNVIGWNEQSGIEVAESGLRSSVVSNSIGVHPSGLPIPNGAHGIRVRARVVAGSALLVGSDTTTPTNDFALRANRILYNLADGISVANGVDMVARGNRIAENGNLAIDLNENGPTPNDADDADAGANALQNSPVMSGLATRIDSGTGDLQVEYLVDSDPANTSYPLAIDFYLAGEGGLQPLVYLGSDTYPAAIAKRLRRVTIVPASPIPAGEQRIVALATTSIDQTSEVSAPVVVPEPAAAAGLLAGILTLVGLDFRRERGRADRSGSRWLVLGSFRVDGAALRAESA